MKAAVRKAPKMPPQIREHEKFQVFLELCESRSWLPLIRNSYVLSQLWWWFCQIQWQPKVKIPVPPIFSQRDR